MNDARRVELEVQLLQKKFGGAFRHQPADKGVIGRIRTDAGREYVLWLSLRDFPQAYPRLFVVGQRLQRSSGAPMGGPEHAMHTDSPDEHGNLQICHTSQAAWRPETSLVSVVVKARLWLAAYELHLRTGRPIAAILPTQAQP